MVDWHLESEVEHYEAFRQTLETIISEGKLEEWVKERLEHDVTWGGNGVPMGPSILPEEETRFHHDSEPALAAVWYFILKGYGNEILDAGITLTQELPAMQKLCADSGKDRLYFYIGKLDELFLHVVPPLEDEAMKAYFKKYEAKIKAWGEAIGDQVIRQEGNLLTWQEREEGIYCFSEDSEGKLIEAYGDVQKRISTPLGNKEQMKEWLDLYVRGKMACANSGQEVLNILNVQDAKP